MEAMTVLSTCGLRYYHVRLASTLLQGVGTRDVNAGNKTNCETCAHVRKSKSKKLLKFSSQRHPSSSSNQTKNARKGQMLYYDIMPSFITY